MTTSLIRTLMNARKRLGLSQAELGRKTGLPRSHLSTIERGETDLRLGSLIEIARVLGFELMLVPKQLAPAVEAMLRGETAERSLPQLLLAQEEEE